MQAWMKSTPAKSATIIPKVAVLELATFSVAVSVEKWRIQKPPLF
jgi:hypothetical protein